MGTRLTISDVIPEFFFSGAVSYNTLVHVVIAFTYYWHIAFYMFKVTVKLINFTDLDFDLDPNWGITPKIETLYNLSCLPDTKNPKNIFTKSLQHP